MRPQSPTWESSSQGHPRKGSPKGDFPLPHSHTPWLPRMSGTSQGLREKGYHSPGPGAQQKQQRGRGPCLPRAQPGCRAVSICSSVAIGLPGGPH